MKASLLLSELMNQELSFYRFQIIFFHALPVYVLYLLCIHRVYQFRFQKQVGFETLSFLNSPVLSLAMISRHSWVVKGRNVLERKIFTVKNFLKIIKDAPDKFSFRDGYAFRVKSLLRISSTEEWRTGTVVAQAAAAYGTFYNAAKPVFAA